jgi:hypothetical protein
MPTTARTTRAMSIQFDMVVSVHSTSVSAVHQTRTRIQGAYDRAVAVSWIVATDRWGVPATSDGAAGRISTRGVLPSVPAGSCPVHRRGGRVSSRLENDLIRADAKELPELPQLGHLRRPPPALPEIDRLRLDADPQRQLELGPTLILPQLPNRLHGSSSLTQPNHNKNASDHILVALL